MARYRNANYQEEMEDEIEEVEQDEVEQEIAHIEPVDAEDGVFKKRYGDLRRYSQKEIDRLKAELEKAKKVQPSEGNKLPRTEEEIQEWTRKYPEVAAMVASIARKQSNEVFDESGVDEKVERIAQLERKIEMEKALGIIRQAHPDFDEIRKDESFHKEWVVNQAAWVKQALYENWNDAQSVIDVLDKYKAQTGKTKPVKEPVNPRDAASSVGRRTSAPAPSDGSGKRFSESQVDRMTLREYEKLEPEIQKAIETGNFDYDKSGGAR